MPPRGVLGLISRIAEVIGSYPSEFVLGVFALGLIAPAGVRRLVRGAAAVAFWMALVVYLLPVGAVWLVLMVVGVRLLLASELEPQPPPSGPFNIWEQVLTRVETTVTSDTTFFLSFRDTVLVSDEGASSVCACEPRQRATGLPSTMPPP